jgi:hypothetical protein
MQVSSILTYVIVVDLNTFWLTPFKTHLPSPRLTNWKQLIFDTKKYSQPITLQMVDFWHEEILTSILS